MSERPKLLDVVDLQGTVVEVLEDVALVEVADDLGRCLAMLDVPWAVWDGYKPSRTALRSAAEKYRGDLEELA